MTFQPDYTGDAIRNEVQALVASYALANRLSGDLADLAEDIEARIKENLAEAGA